MPKSDSNAVMKSIISSIDVCQDDFEGDVGTQVRGSEMAYFVIKHDDGFSYKVTIEPIKGSDEAVS